MKLFKCPHNNCPKQVVSLNPGEHESDVALSVDYTRCATCSLIALDMPMSNEAKWKTRSYPHTDFAKLLDETIDELKKLSSLKGAEYAGDMDRLANFRRNAITLNLIPEQIWAVYAAKHWDAVMQYVSDTAAGIQRKRLEGIEGRLDDLIVYCILMKAMTKERNSYESGK